MTKAPFIPRDLAYQVLRENAELFHWKAELSDLRNHRVNDSPNAHSVRFFQEFKSIPVDASEVVVNIHADGRVQSIYNNYHYNIPQELDPKKIKVKAGQAREIVERLLRVYETSEVGDPVLVKNSGSGLHISIFISRAFLFVVSVFIKYSKWLGVFYLFAIMQA